MRTLIRDLQTALAFNALIALPMAGVALLATGGMIETAMVFVAVLNVVAVVSANDS